MAMVGEKLGWFHTRGRPGDRTLEEQLTGLDELRHRVANKTVLDVGCAEGLIGMQLIDDGALAVHGIEIVSGHVIVGHGLRGSRAITLEHADANTYQPVRQYDIVIMLAILQKLKNPSEACLRFAQAARELVVLRLPPKDAPLVLDERSGYQPYDMDHAMGCAEFVRTKTLKGFRGEWIGMYERRK